MGWVRNAYLSLADAFHQERWDYVGGVAAGAYWQSETFPLPAGYELTIEGKITNGRRAPVVPLSVELQKEVAEGTWTVFQVCTASLLPRTSMRFLFSRRLPIGEWRLKFGWNTRERVNIAYRYDIRHRPLFGADKQESI